MNKRTRIPGMPVPMLALAALAGLIGLMAFLQPAPALADQSRYYLDCPDTEVREGEDVDVFLVRAINHRRPYETFGAFRHTDAGTAGTEDYVHLDTTSIRWGAAAERRVNRVKQTFETRQDALVEGNETLTARFTPTNHVVDMDDPTRDNKCELTILDDDPNITGIEVISEPARDNDTYGVGETIEIEATFSTGVDVDGSPALGLRVGSTSRSASYLRGSGSGKLVFGYAVQPEDQDSDGIAIGASSLSLNEGVIRDAHGNNAALAHTEVAADPGHLVAAPGGL